MNYKSDGEKPLSIPNLQYLYDALAVGSDSRTLLEVFKKSGEHISANLAGITDLWLKEMSEDDEA